MALERVFECSQTLKKVRSGPLGRLLEGFCQWLQDCRYSRRAILYHAKNVVHFGDYLSGESDADRAQITEKEVEGFLQEYPSRCQTRGKVENHLRRVRSSINRFTAYLRQNGLFEQEKQAPSYQSLLDSYGEWLRTYRHAASGTREARLHSLGKFLAWLGPDSTAEGLSELTAERVEQYFVEYAHGVGQSPRQSMQAALRTFFRFCFHKGYIHRHLARAVPTFRTYKLSTVPRGLSEEQALKVLDAVDRSTLAGLRDFAILQLLYTFGVRGGHVRALLLEDIHWAKNQILFKALKNGKDSLLPLTAEVGESLLEYLQKARPHCSDPHVFLTCRAPYRPLLNSCNVSKIVHWHICAAKVEVPSNGAHAFRHCFASRMVQQGHSLKAIADVLGHRDLATTFIYTKIDFNALRQVALEWPQEL